MDSERVDRRLRLYLENVERAAKGKLTAYAVHVCPRADLMPESVTGRNPITVWFPPEISRGEAFNVAAAVVAEETVTAEAYSSARHAPAFRRFQHLFKVRYPAGHGQLIAGEANGKAEKLEKGFSLGFSRGDVERLFAEYLETMKSVVCSQLSFPADRLLFSDENSAKLREYFGFGLSLEGFGTRGESVSGVIL